METRRGPNEDAKSDFGKNIDCLRKSGDGGDMKVDDDGGGIEIQLNEV